jgi:2-polyprenyl-6-methoxyphenol hydroxylase-like FAD-dependent oxidoreductase
VSVQDRVTHTKSELAADLVVDCMGRGSPLPKWLEHSGRPAVARDEVRVEIHYTSLVCEKTTRGDVLDEYVVVSPAPPNLRAGAILAMEGDRYIVTLMGMLGERVPQDEAGFRQFAEQLPSPLLARNLAHLRAVQPVAAFRYPSSQRLHYELVRDFPSGLLVMGDALTSFNPVFGQGITVAALEGSLLDTCLARPRRELAHQFLSAAQRIIDVPWSTAVSNDLRFPAVKGRRTLSMRLIHGYMSKLYRAGAEDPNVALSLLEVINLARAPTALLRPAIVARVLLPSLAPLWGRGDDSLYRRVRSLADANPTAPRSIDDLTP